MNTVKVSQVHVGDYVDIPSVRLSGLVTSKGPGIHPAIVVLTVQPSPDADEITCHLSADRIAFLA